MERLLARWNGFWFADGSPYALGLFRALFALALLFEVGTSYERNLFAVAGGFHLPYAPLPAPVSLETYRLLHGLQYPFLLLLFVGAWPRAACTALLALQGWIFFADQLNFRNHPYFFLIVLLLLALSPCGETFSLHALWRRVVARRRGRPPPARRPKPLTVQRLIQVELSIVYLAAALQKVSRVFLEGHVLAYYMAPDLLEGASGALLRPWFSDATLQSWAAALAEPSNLVLASWATVVLELFLPVALWSERMRAIAIPIGLAFHASIFLLMDIQTFSLAMIGAYLLFLRPETVPRLLAHARAACSSLVARARPHPA